MSPIRPVLTAVVCTLLLATVLAPTAAALMPAPELEVSSSRLAWTYSDGGVWMAGNTHVHSAPHTPYTPEQLALRYRELGQDFMFLTDHDVVTPGVPVEGFLTLPGVEVSIHRMARSPHIVALGVEQPPSWVGRTHDEVLAQIGGDGGFSVLAHPTFVCKACTQPSWPTSEMQNLSHFDAIELFTSATSRSHGYTAPGPVLEQWFTLLGDGRQVWAIATDDAHKESGYGRAFIVVQAHEQSPAGIMAALQEGRFMAAMVSEPGDLPPWPSYMGALDDRLVILADPLRPTSIHVYDERGAVRHTSTAGSLDYVLAGDEGRLVVHLEGHDGGHLFLQPITVQEEGHFENLVNVVLDPALPNDHATPAGVLPGALALLSLVGLRRRRSPTAGHTASIPGPQGTGPQT